MEEQADRIDSFSDDKIIEMTKNGAGGAWKSSARIGKMETRESRLVWEVLAHGRGLGWFGATRVKAELQTLNLSV
jgi:hypothetical protein